MLNLHANRWQQKNLVTAPMTRNRRLILFGLMDGSLILISIELYQNTKTGTTITHDDIVTSAFDLQITIAFMQLTSFMLSITCLHSRFLASDRSTQRTWICLHERAKVAFKTIQEMTTCESESRGESMSLSRSLKKGGGGWNWLCHSQSVLKMIPDL